MWALGINSTFKKGNLAPQINMGTDNPHSEADCINYTNLLIFFAHEIDKARRHHSEPLEFLIYYTFWVKRF